MTADAAPGWRILVVDDEENLNWSLVHSLRKDGYVAEGAASGQEALRLLAEAPYDCVISDVMMPGIDGFELLQWIRGHRPETRVLMMTAFGSPTTRHEALSAGVVAYLEKPFDLRALKHELSRMAQGPVPTASTAPDEYDLLEVAQVLAHSKRDICLAVRFRGEVGHLRFVQGELVWAELGRTVGDEAFVVLGSAPTVGMRPEDDGPGAGGRNVTQPLARLIATAVARRQGAVTAPLAPDDAEPDAPPDADRQGGDESLAEGLARAVQALGAPSGAAVLRMDGSVRAQRWLGRAEAPASVFVHLGQSALAASRALLVGDLGSMEEAHLLTADWRVFVRRSGHADRALLLVALAPRAMALETVRGAVEDCLSALRDLSR
jgi:CheY-like chemotaxis protein